MTNIVLLDSVQHQDLKVDRRHGLAFGDSVNQVLVFPTEFSELHREYPIFFRRDADSTYQSIVLLGLERDENLFLEGEVWRARYVPAIQERGPFIIGVPRGEAAGEPVIQVDLDHPRLKNGEGEPVFLPHGGNTPYLEHVAGVLRTLHGGVETAKAFFAALQKHDLIDSVTVEIGLSDTEHYSVPGLFSISDERFSALDGDALEDLHGAGLLALCIWVLSSRGNVNHLVERKLAQKAVG